MVLKTGDNCNWGQTDISKGTDMCILFEPAIPLPVIILKEITMDGEEFTSKMFLTIFLGGIANNSDKKKKTTVNTQQ